MVQVQVVGQDEVHGDEDGQVMMIKLQLGKEKKEKNKNPMMIKAKVSIGFLFSNPDIRGCDWV